MRVVVADEHRHLATPLVKIGAVARQFGVSLDLLRLYEREGLLIPLKSQHGTRYFTPQDYEWIRTLLQLVRRAHVNMAGIRRLLAMTPCWQMRACGHSSRENCPGVQNRTHPCWIARARCKDSDCYFCQVYRAAPKCEALQALLAPESALLQRPPSGA